jgi:hypothetical protein
MLYTLARLIVKQPKLLAGHAQAYAELMWAEIGRVSMLWKRRFVWNALALIGFAVAAVLGGIALMLWAVVPPEHIQAPWVLVGVPLLALAGALGCLLAAHGQDEDVAFETVRQQWLADMLILREARTP